MVRVCVELTVHVCHNVRLINQCSLYVDKIKIFSNISGRGLYTGTLNRPKITVNDSNFLLSAAKSATSGSFL